MAAISFSEENFNYNEKAVELEDSLLILIEESELEAGESWINFWEWEYFKNQRLSSTGAQLPDTSSKPDPSSQHRISVYGRFRIVQPDSSNPPSHLNRLDLIGNNWEAGFLTHNDPGETNLADNWHLYTIVRNEYFEVLAGDFAFHQALGLTISTTPPVMAGYGLNTPGLKNKDLIRPLRGTEEGFGCRGAAGSFNLGGFNISAWGGNARYDSRLNETGQNVLYADQGNHSTKGRRRAETIAENHLGISVNTNILNNFQMGARTWISDWTETLAENEQPSRFRGSANGLNVIGFDSKFKIGPSFNSAFELTYQDNKSLGGIFSSAYRFDKHLIIAYIYRATLGFSSLHSRPFLPFGSTPAGHIGIYTGTETKSGKWSIGSIYAHDRAESRFNSITGAISQSFRLYARGPVLHNIFLDFRSSIIEKEEQTYSEQRREFRFHIYQDIHNQRRGIRFSQAWENSDDGYLFSLYNRGRSYWNLKWAISLSYILQNDSNVMMTLVEPYGPGQFPVRRTGGEGLKTAFYLEKVIFDGLKIWFRRGIGREFSDSSDSPASNADSTEFDWMLGAEITGR